MKAMNFETSKWSRDAIDDVVVDEESWRGGASGGASSSRSSSSPCWPVAACVHARRRRRKGRRPPARPAQGQQLPAVTVIVPGRQDVPAMISATGSLAARRDMPVGIAGEGGQVERVLVEPGQWVARRPGAGGHRPLGPVAGGGAARRPDRSRPRRPAASPRPISTAPSRWSAAASSARPISTASAPPATPPPPASASPRPISAPPAPASAGSTSAHPTAGLVLTRSVEAGQVVSAGSGALFRIAAGGEMELRARLPQTDLARLSSARRRRSRRSAPAEPIRARRAGRFRRSSIRRPGRATRASSSPIIAS